MSTSLCTLEHTIYVCGGGGGGGGGKEMVELLLHTGHVQAKDTKINELQLQLKDSENVMYCSIVRRQQTHTHTCSHGVDRA